MKKINNIWIDDNNNSWSCDIETEESAQKKSKTLVNCSYCSDCSDCSDCRGCSDCRDCSDCRYCRGCSGCSGCSGCGDCSGCSGCSDCSDYKQNPQRYVTPKIGSRNSQTSIYWTTSEDIKVICGCFSGNLTEFEQTVKKVHANTEYLQPYLQQIEIVKCLISMI
jgi:hypothetical protein